MVKFLMESYSSCYWHLAAALSTSARQEGGPQHSCCGHSEDLTILVPGSIYGSVSNMTMMTWIQSLSCSDVKDLLIALDPFVAPVTFC